MRTEDDRSPLDPMGGPTPADIIADAKGVLGADDARGRAEQAVAGRGGPGRGGRGVSAPPADGRGARAAQRSGSTGPIPETAPRTFEEHIKEATGQFPTVDGREIDPAEAQTSHARRGTQARGGASAGAGDGDGQGRAGLDAARRRAARGGQRAGAEGARRSRAAEDARAEARRQVRARRWLVARIVLIAVAVVLVGVAAAFSCFRWLGGNDAADIQGTWYVNGTDAPITVTADDIVLTDEVSYRYELDPESKTIAFSFSKLDGSGHYRFSLDRSTVAIIDGDFTWWDTLTSDFGWTVEALLAQLRGEALPPASGKNVTLLSRTSATVRQAIRDEQARRAADAQAQAEAEGGLLAGQAQDAAAPAPDAGAAPDDGAPAQGDAAGADGDASSAPADDPVYDPDKPLEPGGNAVDAAGPGAA